MQEEYNAVAFRKKLYDNLEDLLQDLDQWIKFYNHQRPHSGKYKIPMETFKDSINLARKKFLGQVPPAA